MTNTLWPVSSLNEIAERFGTPCYAYDQRKFEASYQAWAGATSGDDLICYAVKANSNLAVLQILARQGSGFDIVSEGELRRVLKAGGDPAKTVFSGVGKSAEAIQFALESGIKCFNVESLRELEHINDIAGSLGKIAPISLRVNPDVDAKTHPYISTGLKENKFGIGASDVIKAYTLASRLDHLCVVGIDCHIGSQITELAPFLDALDRVLSWVDELEQHGIELHHIDLGGGLGVRYKDETPPSPSELISAIKQRLAHRTHALIFEPGRSIAANSGVLLTKVILTKNNGDRHFAIIDAAMNDLARPSLYQSWQLIETLDDSENAMTATWDLVGPVCETGDFIGKARKLALAESSILVIHGAGAYGFSMASNYNSRRRAAEVIITPTGYHLARERESYESLYRDEHLFEG